jgi:uncharacterized protein (TIGR02466 family)
MQLHNLFPTAVGMFDLGREFSAEETEFFLGLEQKPNLGNTSSQNTKVLSSDPMASIKEFVEASVAEYLGSVYAPKNEVGMRVTQSWCNYTKPGQFHHKHEHPNSFISGVLYLQSGPSDRIYFYKNGYQQIKLPTENWNLYNSESWWFEATKGRLILFPSSLTHMVEAVKGDDTRVSLSFNTFPVGHVGDDQALTGLYL